MHKGYLEFEYKGSIKKIEYSLSPEGYGGLPMLIITDKNNHSYNFVRDVNSVWRSGGKEPNWPRDFLDMLYYVFEEKYQELEH